MLACRWERLVSPWVSVLLSAVLVSEKKKRKKKKKNRTNVDIEVARL
jgi:hypothetical protein